MNQWKTRADIAEVLLSMLRPLKKHYSRGCAWLHIGSTAAHYGEKSARMEGFSRVLWGLGPLWSQNNQKLPLHLQEEAEEWLLLYRTGIIHGTDPAHEEYWGDVTDYDQKMVEMAAIALAICLNPTRLWDSFEEEEKENIYQWLYQINQKEVHPNNWRYFRILVNMAFCRVGLPHRADRLKEDFQVIENCYLKDGWYCDGREGQVDYYIAFAMHYYALVYVTFMKEYDSSYAKVLMDRALSFSEDFIYWFANDGTEIPFGRSLTYRFAHSAFFSALAFSEGECPLKLGVLKSMIINNIRQWMDKPIFDMGGILSIGYHYPNLIMSERYNAPGSPYWSLKSFLILALPEEHSFWQAEEETFVYEPAKYLQHPHMLVTHDSNNHIMAFTAGQHCSNHGSSPAKYEKFVYSNQFGFSIPRGNGLEDGAFDNTIAVSVAGDNFYRMRYGVEAYHVSEQSVYMKYNIMPNVTIESTIIPWIPWHIRIHVIETEIAVDVADGGFAIGAESPFSIVTGRDSGKYDKSQIIKRENALFAALPWGLSGVVSMDGGSAELIQPFPNTNLFCNLTVLPTVKKRLSAGIHILVTCVIGDKSNKRLSYLDAIPDVQIAKDGHTAVITHMGEEKRIHLP